MKKQIFVIAAGMVFMASGLLAQTTASTNYGTVTITTPYSVSLFSNQQADTLGDFVFIGGGRGGTGIAGSPVSAREETRTVQTLGDGTQLDTSESDQFYRDNQGRTRTERTVKGETNVQIIDPVAGLRITLHQSNKSATRVTMPFGRGGRGGLVILDQGKEANAGAATTMTARGGRGGGATVVTSTSPRPVSVVTVQGQVRNTATNVKREELGLQMQNGVMAEGLRETRTIPAGAIGNNRDIQVVNESWFSKDLQMMVKTINSDPRFGTTTYEMTNISQAAPDGGLFMIPAGYTITEQAGRGAMQMVPLDGGR